MLRVSEEAKENEYKYSFLEKIGLEVLKRGRIPRHIAFIMDGNRRFARGEGLKVTEGHLKGLNTAKNVAQLVL